MLIQASDIPSAFYGPTAGLALAVFLLFYIGKRYIDSLTARAERAEQSEKEWQERTLDLLTQTERLTKIAEKTTGVATDAAKVVPDMQSELDSLRAELQAMRDGDVA